MLATHFLHEWESEENLRIWKSVKMLEYGILLQIRWLVNRMLHLPGTTEMLKT